MKKTAMIVFSTVFSTHLSFAATLHSMNKNEVEKTFINKTFVSIGTDNLNGRTIENTFSMFLDDNGRY